MIQRDVGRCGIFQRRAGMADLPATLFAAAFAQTAHPRRLLPQPVARRRLAAVAAVKAKPTLKLRNPRQKHRILRNQQRVLRPQRRNQRIPTLGRRGIVRNRFG